jgi:ATP-binding cassette subfamily C (CFTR/MRP) protein 1
MILYLFFTLLFDAARARTLWLRQQDDFNKIIAIAFTISVGLKFGALILEAVEKRRFLRPEYKTYPPEAIGGIFNRSFFWWLNPLFRQGFSKLLAVEDLYVLDKHLSSERYHDRMDAEWNKGMNYPYFTFLFL